VFPERVEKWRSLTRSIAPDLPEDIVLAIIWHESNGKVSGLVGQGKTRCGVLPLRGGGSERICHALGLMQVIPGNIAKWNERHPNGIVYLDDMLSLDPYPAKKQITLGANILRGAFAHLHRYWPRVFPWPEGVLTDDQIRIGLMSYAYGQGRIGPKLTQLQNEGLPLTFDNFAERWPTLGYPQNRPVHYSQWVWARAHGQKGPPRRPAQPTKPVTEVAGVGPAVALLALAFFAFGKRG